MKYLKPIKFRGRSLETGEYVFGEIVDYWGTGAKIGYWVRAYGAWELRWENVDPDSVAQLVGYDSKGEEVYEGDTMTNDDGKPFIVMLKPQGCTFREKDGRRDYSSIHFDMTGHNAIKNFTVKK